MSTATKDLREMSFMELLGSLKTAVETADPSIRLAPLPKLPKIATVEACSAVTRADWPTRQNDQNCTLRALAICANPGCEAPLCALHLEICRVCAQEFCEGCFSLHAEDHKGRCHVAE